LAPKEWAGASSCLVPPFFPGSLPLSVSVPSTSPPTSESLLSKQSKGPQAPSYRPPPPPRGREGRAHEKNQNSPSPRPGRRHAPHVRAPLKLGRARRRPPPFSFPAGAGRVARLIPSISPGRRRARHVLSPLPPRPPLAALPFARAAAACRRRGIDRPSTR